MEQKVKSSKLNSGTLPQVIQDLSSKNIEEVFSALKSRETGLSEAEVENRQKTSGFNEIKIREAGAFDVLLRQFKSPFFYLLFAAAIVAFFIGEPRDSAVILAFVVINVCLGFLQEYRAERTLRILKTYVPLMARAIRDGKEKIIERRNLVPGDVVLLEAGDIVPADLRLIRTENFLIDESVLSGESAPVAKSVGRLSLPAKDIFEAGNIVFASTTVISGDAEGIVIATGKETSVGEIAKLTIQTKKESAFEKGLFGLSKTILKVVVLSIVSIFLINLFIKGGSNFFEFLIFSIALIVSIIPEALPLVTTYSLSRGALRLAKRKVVVKRLASIEDLGSIEVLCTDKTGTITENNLRARKFYPDNKEKILLYGLLSSSYLKEKIETKTSSFDCALWQIASDEIKKRIADFEQLAEMPFDPNRLRNSVIVRAKDSRMLIVKGAPEIIFGLSDKIEKDGVEIPIEGELDAIKSWIKQEGEQGARILAVAYKTIRKEESGAQDEQNLTFLGCVSFSDPLKKSAKSAIHLAEKLRLKMKILTGDSPEVAGAVAKEIGLIGDVSNVITGAKLLDLDDAAFAKACDEFKVFARITPQLKYKIVEALRKNYEVGFLGEGINDAPALKLANVSIAVREAADISREAADIVLLKKDLGVLVDGIVEGRNIFANVSKYIKCTLASNFGNFYSIAAISLFIPYLPMLPIQILFVNLLTDFPLIAIASDRVDVEELRRAKLYQINKMFLLVLMLGAVSTIFDFIFFGFFHRLGPDHLRTLWFIESILTEIALIFIIRTHKFFLKTKKPSVPLVILAFFAIAITLMLPFSDFGQEIFDFVRPPVSALAILFGLMVAYFIASEIVKLTYFNYWHKGNTLKTAS